MTALFAAGCLLALVPTLGAGRATTFSAAGDSGNPDPHAACLGRDLNDRTDLVVASRDLPCRSALLVCLPRAGRCVAATVGDRGPYGLSTRHAGYRAVLDLAPALRRALRHNGYEPVVYFYWKGVVR